MRACGGIAIRGIRPRQPAGYEHYRNRLGRDLGQVDPSLSQMYRRRNGDEDWSAGEVTEVATMRMTYIAVPLGAPTGPDSGTAPMRR